MLKLGFSFSFSDLYARAGLVRVDAAFLRYLGEGDADLAERLLAARARPETLTKQAESELLIALAPTLEDFVAALFGIQAEVEALSARHAALAPLYTIKRLFVQRRAMHKIKPDEAARLDGAALEARLVSYFGLAFSELVFAREVAGWLKDEARYGERIDTAVEYAAWASQTPEGAQKHRAGVLFKAPAKLNFAHLVPVHTDTTDGYSVHTLLPEHLRRRDGFALTDAGTDLTGALDEANYCIWCHEQGKDSCSTGLREKAAAKKTPGEVSDGSAPAFKKNIFGVTQAGCPLEEKISEFHKVKTQGHAIGALAVICIDNPLVAATGHRICNDCMKSCIYQKQEPVDIPQAETRTLKDVLELPYGFQRVSRL